MSFINAIIDYFFRPLPIGPFRYLPAFVGIVIVLFIFPIGLRIMLKKKKDDKIFRKYHRDLPGKIQTIAICLAIYIIARYVQIPFLSMRILHYTIFIILGFIIIRHIQIHLKDYPEAKKEHAHQLEMNKYLPRKHKK